MGSKVSNIQRLSNPMGYAFSVAGFLTLMALVVGALYYATDTVDYIWRWSSVPKYFAYKEDVVIRAEENGEAKSITQNENGFAIVISEDGGDDKRFIVPEGSFEIDEGDMISMGDTIAEYKGEWKAGMIAVGLWLTLKISIISTIIGIIIGILGGVARVSDTPVLKWTAMTYVEIIRGSPLLVQIMIAYFVVGTTLNKILAMNGLPRLSPEWYGIFAMSVFTGAYVVEIVRAGIESIHPGQVEAARSAGMNYFQCTNYIILPQALKTILPPLAGQFINLIKDSSLLGMIAVRELTKATREGIASSLATFELWIVCAILYLMMTFTLSMFVQWLERRTATK